MAHSETKIISYNLRNGKASHELLELVTDYDIDALCLQECENNTMPDSLNRLVLADATETNRLGLAVYYNPLRYTLLDTQHFALQRSLHDVVLKPADKRLLAVLLQDRQTGEKTVIASFHAAPLSATNGLRRKQILAAHSFLKSFGNGAPVIMAGDFNYPLFKKKLRKTVEGSGYALTLSNKRTYSRIFRGHFDFVTSTDIPIEDVRTLPKGTSDHKPILVTF